MDTPTLEIDKLTLCSCNGIRDANMKVCAMEAVAWIAGEPHSSRPQCACPVITKFMITWNDGIQNHEDRDRLLKPLIPLIVGTRSTPEIERERSQMALDWLLRVHAPAWLELAGLKDHADTLRVDPSLANCNAAWAAAENVAGVRTRAAVNVTAGIIAGAAAGITAGAAAGITAGDTLLPTTQKLQLSAVELVKSMCALKP